MANFYRLDLSGLVATRPMHILLIEDDKSTRETLEMLFDEIGKKYISAANLSDGLEKLKKNHVSMILLDYILEDGTGREIIERAREWYNEETPCIVLMTASSCYKKLAEELKPDHLLRKPFELDNLIKLLC